MSTGSVLAPNANVNENMSFKQTQAALETLYTTHMLLMFKYLFKHIRACVSCRISISQ